jgi:UDP-glucose 4-epimerase
VIIDFIEKLRNDPSQLEILGDGNQRKSYLHVKDLIAAFMLVLGNLDKSRSIEIYNVGSHDQTDVKRIAEIVCEEMRIEKPRFRFNNTTGDGRGWKSDVKTMQLSIGKLMDLGWKPSMCSEEAIRTSCRELITK